MESVCLLHNTRTCGKRKTIARERRSTTIRVAYAFEWGTQSDTAALIYEEVQSLFREIEPQFPELKYSFATLGGKDGSIYCDICRQIRSADVVLCDLSTHNANVIFELGHAIGSGTYVFLLRSAHYRRRTGLSDLNGILEHRFSRRGGRLNFQGDFRGALGRKLRAVSKTRTSTISTGSEE